MRGIVRFDYILCGGEVYLSEINTVPGSLSYYLLSNGFKDFYLYFFRYPVRQIGGKLRLSAARVLVVIAQNIALGKRFFTFRSYNPAFRVIRRAVYLAAVGKVFFNRRGLRTLRTVRYTACKRWYV